jgi:hypothetical protein
MISASPTNVQFPESLAALVSQIFSNDEAFAQATPHQVQLEQARCVDLEPNR